MGHLLSTLLNRLHSDLAPDHRRESEVDGTHRAFQRGDPIYQSNYADSPMWISATILRATSPVSYEVSNATGRILCHHVDQLQHLVAVQKDCREPLIIKADPAADPAAESSHSVVVAEPGSPTTETASSALDKLTTAAVPQVVTELRKVPLHLH